jgi:hypothetical protein
LNQANQEPAASKPSQRPEHIGEEQQSIDEKDRTEQDRQSAEPLCKARAAQRFREFRSQRHCRGHRQRRHQPKRRQRRSKQRVRTSRDQRNERGLIYVAKGRSFSTDYKIQFIAEDAVGRGDDLRNAGILGCGFP